MTQDSVWRLRALERALLETDAIPLVGGIPPFPTEAILQALCSAFNVSDLDLKISIPSWVEAKERYSTHVQAISLSCPPLKGGLAFLMDASNIGSLIEVLCGPGSREIALVDSPLRGGFVEFLALEILAALRICSYPAELIPQIHDQLGPLTGPALAIDVSLSTKTMTAKGQLLLSDLFCKSARQAFLPKRPTHLSQELAQALTVNIPVVLGEVSLNRETFCSLNPGDFIILDRALVDPVTGQGTVRLEMTENVVCEAKLSKGGLLLAETS